MDIQKRLFELADTDYKQFNSKLIPTVNHDSIIGVRTPALRKLAKELYGTSDNFMETLPHDYYEEYNLHGFLIEKINDYDKCICALNKFLPYVDNWATCDLVTPKILKKYPDRLLEQISMWLESKHTYTVRFAIKMLMSFYLDANFDTRYPEMVSNIKSEEYYINMMIAWYFATALAKQYEATLPFVENNCLDRWVHNKTIQKAIESFRITDEQKSYLKKLKR